MSVVTIWSRATVLPVRLQLAPAGAASDLELLVLEAVAAGVDDATDLAHYFGVPRRIMIDIVGDLWRSQRLTVALGEDSEQITISGMGLEAIAAGASGEYESAMRTPHTEHVLLDSLSGQFVPVTMSRPRLRDRRHLVPAQPDDPDHRQILPHHLAEAVARALRKRGDSDERVGARRIVSARLVPSVLAGAEEIRYVPLDVDVARRADGGLSFRLLESVWPPDVQRFTVERLQCLADDAAGSDFVRALQTGAGERLVDAVPLGRALTHLRNSAEALAATPHGRRQSAHDKVAGKFDELCHQVADLARRETSVRLVHGRSDHDRALTTVADAATQQLLVALPWIHYDELAKHQEALAAAARRGVGITVLWGINREDETLEGRVLRLLDEVSREAVAAGRGGFVHVDREQSSHIHAKVVAADDRIALITSRNLFSKSDLFEVGVLVEAPADGRSPVVQQLSTWAYNTTPNLGHANHLIRDPAVYGPLGNEVRWSAPIAPAVDMVQLASEDCSPELLKLWQRGWCEAVEGLEGDAVRPAPVAYLVADGLHQSLLHAALRDAERRVVVSSHKLSSRVLDGGLIEHIRQCVDRGVRVSLYYGSTTSDDDARALKRLEEACRERSGRLEVVQRTNLHAKVLAYDDEVIVGSYNFLSFDATYGAGRGSQRAEISLRVVDRDFTDTVIRLLSTTHFRGGARMAGPPATPKVLGPAALAVQVVESLTGSEASQVATITGLVQDSATLASVHEELRASGALPGLARRMDAALVSGATGPVHDRAVLGLLERSWEMGDVVVAHVMRSAVEDGTVRPRPRLTAAVAAVVANVGDAEDAVTALMVADDSEPSEQWCLAVVRMLSILHEGDTKRATGGAISGLDGLSELATWHQAALDHVVVHGRLPLDLASIMRADEDGSVEEMWASMPPLIDRMARWTPNHRETDQAREYLVAEPLRVLREIAVTQDGERLVGWVRDNRGTTDGGWLDDNIRKAGVRIRIDSARRRYLLHVTRPLLLTARALADRTTSSERSETMGDDQMDAFRRLGETTTALLSVLPDDVDLGPARAGLRTLARELGREERHVER